MTYDVEYDGKRHQKRWKACSTASDALLRQKLLKPWMCSAAHNDTNFVILSTASGCLSAVSISTAADAHGRRDKL